MSEDSSAAVEKALFHRSFVLKELLDSEQEYVRRLQMVVEDYLEPIQAGGDDIPEGLKPDILAIFSTLPEIYAFHRDVFLQALEESKDVTDDLMNCFLSHSEDFKRMYLPYCKNKPTSDTARVEHESFFHQRQSVLGSKLGIEDLLIAPVQRFTKYQLLIRDLLKDTRKAQLDTTVTEEALELMQLIPKETNNIICLSLLRGIPRASLLGHGSLWRQECLQLWVPRGSGAAGGAQGELRQVYLFDHRILLASPPDQEGFFHYQTAIKTLQGSVVESVEGEPQRFGFTTAEGDTYHFQAQSQHGKETKAAWVKDLDSLLNSHSKMMKALMFGKAASPKAMLRTQSVGLQWSESDSSVDSMPSSEDEKEPDWPNDAGFQSVKTARSKPHPVRRSEKKPKKRAVTISISHSSTCPEFAEVEGLQRSLTSVSTLNPRLLARWLTRNRRTSSSEDRKRRDNERPTIPFPTAPPRTLSLPTSDQSMAPRSPGAIPRLSHSPLPSNPLRQMVYVGKGRGREKAEGEEERLYHIPPGQVCEVEEVQKEEVWRVKLLSGGNSGSSVCVPRSHIEEYSAPVSALSIGRAYKMKKDVGSGRFSRVHLAKHRGTESHHALKVLKSEVSQTDFSRELCIGFRLRHRNLTPYIGGYKGKERAIAMEYIPGHPLIPHLTHHQQLTEPTLAALIAQLLDALHYLHSHTILHLDVRPDNILVLPSKKGPLLKLLDYGAARHLNPCPPLQSDYEPAHSYQYSAPEMFQQLPLETGTDIWSVGILMFIIFYGRAPFDGGSPMNTIANITTINYFFPSEVCCSVPARELIMALLVLDPCKRPSAQDVKQFHWFSDSAGLGQALVDLEQLKGYS